MALPSQSLHLLRSRECSHMLLPSQSLHSYLVRPCSHSSAPCPPRRRSRSAATCSDGSRRASSLAGVRIYRLQTLVQLPSAARATARATAQAVDVRRRSRRRRLCGAMASPHATSAAWFRAGIQKPSMPTKQSSAALRGNRHNEFNTPNIQAIVISRNPVWQKGFSVLFESLHKNVHFTVTLLAATRCLALSACFVLFVWCVCVIAVSVLPTAPLRRLQRLPRRWERTPWCRCIRWSMKLAACVRVHCACARFVVACLCMRFCPAC